MSLQSAMRQFLLEHLDLDDTQLAKEFAEQVGSGALSELLGHEFRGIRRDIQRADEVEELARHVAARRAGQSRAWSESIRQHKIAYDFQGSRVPFGQLTVEQHRVRIAMLKAQRRGIDRTIELHEQAVQDIEAAGVVCLDDLPGAA